MKKTLGYLFIVIILLCTPNVLAQDKNNRVIVENVAEPGPRDSAWTMLLETYEIIKNYQDSHEYQKVIETVSTIRSNPSYQPTEYYTHFFLQNRAKSYLILGEREKALADIDTLLIGKKENKDEQVRHLYRDAVYSLEEWAIEIIKDNNHQEAKNKYNQILDFYKYYKPSTEDIARIYFNRGLTNNYLGEFNEAVDDFDRSIANANRTKTGKEQSISKTYCERANAYYRLGKIEKAVLDYEKAIKLDASNELAFLNLFYVLNSENQFDKIIQWKETYVKNNDIINAGSNAASIYFYLGVAYHKTDNIDMAIECYDKTIQLSPDYSQAYNNLATINDDLKEYDKALYYINKALDIKETPQAIFNRGLTYTNLKEYDKAISDFDKLIDMDYDLKNSYLSRAVAKDKINDLEGALIDYDKALEIDPDFTDAKSNKANILNKLGKQNEANMLWSNLISENEDNFALYYNRANYYMDRKMYPNAAESYLKALEIVSTSSKNYNIDIEAQKQLIRLRLAYSYHYSEQWKSAIKYYQEYMTENVEDNIIISNIGYCYLHLGEINKAKIQFGHASDMDNENIDPLLGMAMIFYMENNWEEVNKYLNKIWEIRPDLDHSFKAIEQLESEDYSYTTSEKEILKKILETNHK